MENFIMPIKEADKSYEHKKLEKKIQKFWKDEDTFSKVKVSGRMEKWCVNLSLDTLGIYLMHIALLDYFENKQFIVGSIPHVPGILLLSIVCFVICGIVAAVLRRLPFVGKYLC